MIILGGVTVTGAISTGLGFAVISLLLLRESEETRVQRALEASWVQLDDARSMAWSKGVFLLRELSKDFSHFLDLLFGNELDSPRAFSVSVCVSLLVTASIGLLQGCQCGESASAVRVIARLIFASGAILALVINAKRDDGRASIFLLAALTVWLLAINPTVVPMALVIFPLSYLVDVVMIRHQRKLFRESADAESIWHVARILGLSVLLVLVVFALPIGTANGMMRVSRASMDGRWAKAAEPVGILGSMNLSTVLLPALFASYASFLLLNRAAWSLLERLVYTLQRTRIFEYRKALGGVGLLLISPSLWHYLRVLIARLVH